MKRHLIPNLMLLGLTILICSALYPAVLWGIGQLALNDKANGSLIKDKDGVVIGSRLIAQPFVGDEYFQPRPSAVSYNAAATGGSNLGPNNPALRKRVVGMLGKTLKYRNGKPVGPDIEAWAKDDNQTDLFERWWKAHPDADVEPVPSDLVMASGAGLDRHITLKAARYQLDRVAGKWAETMNKDVSQIKQEIDDLLIEKSEAPLGGLVGADLVNVLEVNLALRERLGRLRRP